jgi:methyl-accepting chemotaxis protein
MQDDTFRWVITGAVAISTLCIFLMAAVSIALYLVASKLKNRVESIAGRVEPLVETVRKLADENSTKISGIATRAVEIADNAKDISDNAKDISDVARDQAHRFAEVGRDVADRTRAQVARVDTVVDQTVSQVQVLGVGVKEAVMKPVREASGVMAGIRAAVSTYAAGSRPTVDHTTQEEEMFI